MDEASDAIMALKPVSFRYKKQIDPRSTPQFGLVAEEVARVNPDLVVRGKGGEPYTVRYDAVNVMLLNEFLKEHKKVETQQTKIATQEAAISQQDRRIEEQDATIAQLKQATQTLTTQLKEQAAQIQKVSAQIEMNTRAPQMARNP
jgi:hypothetical protein